MNKNRNVNKKPKNQPNLRDLSGLILETYPSTDVNVLRLKNDGEQKKARGTKEKYFEAAATVNPVTGGAIVDLFAPAQGVGVVQRVGDSCIIKRMFIHLDSTITLVGATNFITRVIVFQWLPNSVLAVPTPTDILQTAVYNSFREFNTSDQYVVLYDRVFSQSGLTVAPSSSSTISDWSSIQPKKRFDALVQFSPAATTGARKIYMLHIGSTAAVSTVLLYNTRIVFADE